MKNISFLGLCVFAIIIITGVACAVKNPILPKDATSTKIKPDIISDLQVTHVSGTSEWDTFLITATLTNSVRGTSTGPFEVRLDWRAIPRTAPQYSTDPDFLADIPWNYLNSRRIENLINDPSKRSLPSITINFDNTLPKLLESDRYIFRLTTDYTNQVEEAREYNNGSSAAYPSWYPVPYP